MPSNNRGVDDEYREVADLLRAGRETVIEKPGSHVWDAIAAATDPQNTKSGDPAVGQPKPETPQGSSPSNASLRDSEPSPDDGVVVPLRPAAQTTARRTFVWGAAAACLAVGLATGFGLGRSTTTSGPSPEAAPTVTVTATPTTSAQVLSQVKLNTLDTGTPVGQAIAQQVGGALSLQVEASAKAPTGGYLEVWLINTDGVRMISLGVLGADKALLPITQDLLDEGYRIVDVSREAFDDKPAHSGDSLMRGELPTA